MEARADRTDRASDALRRFFVAQLFQLAKHDRFAKLRRQIAYGGTDLLRTLLALGPMHRRDDVGQAGERVNGRLVRIIELNLPREAFEMFHDAIAGDAVQISGEGSALRVVLSWAHASGS